MPNTLFNDGLNPIDARVFKRLAIRHRHNFKANKNQQKVTSYLITQATHCLDSIEQLQRRNLRFKKRVQLAHSLDETQETLLEYSAELGANKKQLKQDKKALARYLDAEALNDRFAKQVSNLERETIYLLGRITPAIQSESKSNHPLGDKHIHANQLTALLERTLLFNGDFRVKIAGINSIESILNLNISRDDKLVSNTIKQLIFRYSQDVDLDNDTQIAALNALAAYDSEQFCSIAKLRLSKPLVEEEYSDDFFIRAEILRSACLNHQVITNLPELITLSQTDPSDFVRQQLARSAIHLTFQQALTTLLHIVENDKADEVLATALLRLLKLPFPEPHSFTTLLSPLAELFTSNISELNTRALLDIIPRLACKLSDHPASTETDLHTWYQRFEPLISELHQTTDNLKIRRWAASSRDALWVNCHRVIRSQFNQLNEQLNRLPISRIKKVNSPKLRELSDEQLGRLLSVLCQEQFGLDVQRTRKGLKVTRWYQFKFRLWRFIYELRHSATDKRQGHKHMVGRVFYGLMAIPSNRLAEQTKTNVPGEPVTITEEDGPRNYLPLVDELISCLDQNWPTRPLHIYTCEGITQIYPPDGFFTRLRARWELTWRFDDFARLRNWQNGAVEPADAYLSELAKLGFKFNIYGYTDPQGQPYPIHSSVKRFFPSLSLPTLLLLWNDVKEYFFSVYANNLKQLWLFLIGLLTFFLFKHASANHQMNLARQAVPLSVGGWGTRGKSGTERLKAAIFNGLGLNIISKTTGCEAMFLEGTAHQKLREMFLFRPYDKATIWEQVNLMKLARRLNADVFLWECMGLTPAYVHILQRHWMRDDIATITNTYPDHEDVQGPAGIDIPKVMNEFIPAHSKLITSEEIMYPILEHGAQAINTDCIAVTWRDTMTVAKDILARFPYEEHPNNIALVTRMANELGIARGFALKSMADHVVLDLGVLKTYPRSNINGRTLEYVMGNSANERLGALGNWRRMGFEQHTLADQPDMWVSTIVNNRADRIPRSKVFASILVKDISADQHVIIGTNVDGFETFLHDAWEEEYADFSIWQNGDDIEEATQLCKQAATRLRIAVDSSQIKQRLTAMCLALEANTETLDLHNIESLTLPENQQHHLVQIKSTTQTWLEETQALNEIIANLPTQSHDSSNLALLKLIKDAFFSRVIFLYDSLMTGESIISCIVEATPPGLTNRIMGMQNIKGTGLDFVYRWQAWERCHKACELLKHKDEKIRLEALTELRGFEEYGQLSKSYVLNQIKKYTQHPNFQSESMQADLQGIEGKLLALDTSTAIEEDSESTQSEMSPFLIRLIGWVEQVLDLSDAVKRRQTADQIYDDLASFRISRARAAVQLQKLTKRQKGGWLLKSIKQ